MKITKERLLQIIKEETVRHGQGLLLELNIKALLKKIDDVGGAAAAAKLASQGKLFSKRQMRRIAGAIDDPGIGRDGIDKKVLRAYDKQAKAPPTRLDKTKDVAKKVAAANIGVGVAQSAISGTSSVTDRLETYIHDVYKTLKDTNVLKGKLRFSEVKNAFWQWLETTTYTAADILDVVSPAEVARNIEMILMTPSTIIGQWDKKRRENGIYVVWPNYRVSLGRTPGAGLITADNKIPFGHAGVILIVPQKRKYVAMYWDVGRTSGGTKSRWMRKGAIVHSDVKYDREGEIINVEKLLRKVKSFYTGGRALEAAISKGVDLRSAVKYARDESIAKGPYSWKSDIVGTSCGVWAFNVLAAGGGASLTGQLRTKAVVAPRTLKGLVADEFDERELSV